MPKKVYVIALSLIAIAVGCKSTDNSAATNTSGTPAAPSPAVTASPAASPDSTSAPSAKKSKIDSCKLLTSDDLKQVQGEPLKEAQPSEREEGGFIVSQCYYSLPTSSNSVVVNVTASSEGAGARDPRKYWQETFARNEKSEKERERERKLEEGEEEEKSVAPQKVAGLGEDACWIASRVGGALYVLKKDLFFRISVGGPGDANAKLKKSKTLAQRVLKRI